MNGKAGSVVSAIALLHKMCCWSVAAYGCVVMVRWKDCIISSSSSWSSTCRNGSSMLWQLTRLTMELCQSNEWKRSSMAMLHHLARVSHPTVIMHWLTTFGFLHPDLLSLRNHLSCLVLAVIQCKLCLILLNITELRILGSVAVTWPCVSCVTPQLFW